MDQIGIDKLLKRRLYLQRYVTSLFNDVSDMNAKGDRALLKLLREFIEDADEKTLLALSRRNNRNTEAAAVLAGMTGIIVAQRDQATAHIASEMSTLIEREAEVTASSMGAAPPSVRGVSSLPVDGKPQGEIMAAAFALYATRLLSDISKAAVTEPDGIIRLVRGTRTQNWVNGLLSWRDNRLIRPNIDLIVNGNAANAASHVYGRSGVRMVRYLATLDFRTCLECSSLESQGIFEYDKRPYLPRHPNCRCLLVGADTDPSTIDRPTVRDSRSVKDIPLDERTPGKIGTTRRTMKEFIDSMTYAERAEWMGPSRANLWREGKITDVRQLVNDVTLEPLRLDQLPS